MDHRAETSDFLSSRRARTTPQQAGLPSYGGRRRVAGLRREEVATLAGVSTDYYTRLERGNLAGVSGSVLDALARALQLDEAETAHLADLAAAAGPGARGRRTSQRRSVRPGVQRILDTIGGPAYVRDGCFDVHGTNAMGRALHPHLAVSDSADAALPNLARYLFLDPDAQETYVAWAAVAEDLVAALRIEAGRAPHDRRLTDLVGELAVGSEEFATWWAGHDVRLHRTSTKRLRHPVVGEVEVTGEALALPGDEGLTIVVYTVEPESAAQEALTFLSSWAASAGEVPQTLPRPHVQS